MFVRGSGGGHAGGLKCPSQRAQIKQKAVGVTGTKRSCTLLLRNGMWGTGCVASFCHIQSPESGRRNVARWRCWHADDITVCVRPQAKFPLASVKLWISGVFSRKEGKQVDGEKHKKAGWRSKNMHLKRNDQGWSETKYIYSAGVLVCHCCMYFFNILSSLLL